MHNDWKVCSSLKTLYISIWRIVVQAIICAHKNSEIHRASFLPDVSNRSHSQKYCFVCASLKKKEDERGKWYIHTLCAHHSCIRVHTRKRRGERSSGEPRFSEEIFPGSHFPGGLARSDSSFVFRRDFIAEKSALERGRLQVTTAIRTIRLAVHACMWYMYMCACAYASATRQSAIIFYFSLLLLKRNGFALVHLAAEQTIRGKKSHTAEKSKSAIMHPCESITLKWQSMGNKRRKLARTSCYGFFAQDLSLGRKSRENAWIDAIQVKDTQQNSDTWFLQINFMY